jgi:hypothetical protein
MLTVATFLAVVGTIASAWAETVDTRVGPLEVINGFPTVATAEKLFAESHSQRATQAYLWRLPAVGFH